MSEWSTVRLGEIAEILVGYAFKSSMFTADSSGVRLLRGANVHQGFLDWGQEVRWPSDESYGARYELSVGDVVLAMDRPWIEAGLKRARIRSSDLPALLVQRVARLRGTSRASTSFIHHTLATERFSRYLQRQVTGATVPHISQTQIAAYELQMPPPAVERRICEFLDAMDDLIENNRRRVEVLEKVARAIYREWFVKLRYPGHDDVPLVDSTLGPIPKGWERVPLGEVVSLDRPGVQPGMFPCELFDHYSLPAFDRDRSPALDVGAEIKSSKFVVTAPAVLVPKLNPRINRTWYVEPVAERRSIASTEYLVLRPREAHSLTWLHLLATSQPFRDRLVSLSGGTSTSHQRIKPQDLLEIEVLVAPQSVSARLTDTVAPMLTEAHTLVKQGNRLTRLRDLLLPKLVMGQIDVSTLNLDAVASTGSTAGSAVA